MARGTRPAVLLLCVLAAVLLADARHLLATEESLQSAKSAAVQQASPVGEIEEVQQLSQLVGDIDSEEGGLELQAALWKRAKKQGKCIFNNKIVDCQGGNSYPKEEPDYAEDSRANFQSKQATAPVTAPATEPGTGPVTASISTYVVPDDNYGDTDYDDDDDTVDYDGGYDAYAGGKHKGKHAAKHSKGAHHGLGKQHYKRSKLSRNPGDKGYGYAADSHPHQHYFPRMDYAQPQPRYTEPPRYTDPTNQQVYNPNTPSSDVPGEYYAEGPASEPGHSHPHIHRSHSKHQGAGEYDTHPHPHHIHPKAPSSGDYDGTPASHYSHSTPPSTEEYDSHSLTHHSHSKAQKYEDVDSTAYGQPLQKHHHHMLHKHSKAGGHKGKAYDRTPDNYQEPDAEGPYGEDNTYSTPSSPYGSSKDTTPAYPKAKSQYGGSKETKQSHTNIQQANSSTDNTAFESDNEDASNEAASIEDSTTQSDSDVDSEDASSQESKPSHPKGTTSGNKNSHKGSNNNGSKDMNKREYSAPPPPPKKYTGKSWYEREMQDTIGHPPKPNTKSYKRDPMEYWDEEEADAEAGYNIEVYTQVANPAAANPAATKQAAATITHSQKAAAASAAAAPAGAATSTVLGTGQSQ